MSIDSDKHSTAAAATSSSKPSSTAADSTAAVRAAARLCDIGRIATKRNAGGRRNGGGDSEASRRRDRELCAVELEQQWCGLGMRRFAGPILDTEQPLGLQQQQQSRRRGCGHAR